MTKNMKNMKHDPYKNKMIDTLVEIAAFTYPLKKPPSRSLPFK